MKTSTKNILATVILETVISFAVNAQTNVSGGIFTNTTWTLSNSPYIVVDTVVVFPGVTLTVEPGVTVKFDDDMYIEFRQSTLIAIGTVTDSITFTSNSLSPIPGIWGHNTLSHGGIWLNGNTMTSAFNFCNIRYATSGIGGNTGYLPYIKNSTFTNNENGIYDVSNTQLDSCIFKFNTTGIDDISSSVFNFCTITDNNMGAGYMSNSVMNNCIIDSNYQAFGGATGQINGNKLHYCSISHNHSGFISASGSNLLDHCVINYNTNNGVYIGLGITGADSIIYCHIKYNGTGVGNQSGNVTLITKCEIEYNTIGISLNNSNQANIYCNKICNNISYGLQMNTSSNFNAANNYWCTTDSTQIAAAIYDAYDNVSSGFVNFMPVDSLQCYITTSINEIENQELNFTIFPNPAFDYLTLFIPGNVSKAELTIFNAFGAVEYSSTIIQPKTNIDVSTLPAGIYIVEIAAGNTITRRKFMRQQSIR